MKYMDNKLQQLLWSEKMKDNSSVTWACKDYREDVNPDALTEDWLKNDTSWKWKVGVFTLIDSNKCDFVYVYIGMQRFPTTEPEFIGKLSFPDGENDDIARVIDRAINLLTLIHPVFQL